MDCWSSHNLLWRNMCHVFSVLKLSRKRDPSASPHPSCKHQSGGSNQDHCSEHPTAHYILSLLLGKGGTCYKLLNFWWEGESSFVTSCLLLFACHPASNDTTACCWVVAHCNHRRQSCVLFVSVTGEVEVKISFLQQHNGVLPGSSSWSCWTKMMHSFTEEFRPFPQKPVLKRKSVWYLVLASVEACL